MLVSHDHKFIYLKSRKTASTSLERYFLPYCKNGIIELKRGHKPAAEVKEIVGQEIWNEYTKICAIRNPWDKMVSYYFWKRRLPLFNKMARKLHLKSNYNEAHEMNFHDFIDSLNPKNIDRKIFYIDNAWQDYELIRYETLHEDLERICKTVGISYEPTRLGHNKSMYRPKQANYRQFYDEKTRMLIEKAYATEIEKLGYQF